ncbi:MAG TPA: MATE family efflux transporter [Candidatus Kryptonia bacterium]|nr:MATE family efflux transporter [Candidatus Kryptonia bacterium]
MATTVDVVVAGPAQPTRGGVPEVALLAYPVVLQTLSDTIMQVVDSAIVGHLGVTELGAVGFGGVWLWTLMVIFVGTATGVQTFVAQAFGAGRRRECGPWVWQSIYALLPAAAVWFTAVALLFGKLVQLMGPSPELQTLAVHYAHARLWGAPAVVVGVACTSFFRGLGDTRTPLAGTMVAISLNAVAAYGLVFGRFGLPAWGIAGAGAATAMANWTYASILVVALLRPRVVSTYATTPVRPHLATIWRYVRTSVPIGGQWLLDMISFALFSTIIARMGNASIAASQAMIQLLSMSFMQAFGISIASGALVGRYVGARDLDAATRSHHSALKLGITFALAVFVLFLSVPDVLLGIFTADPEVLRLGRPLLALGAVFQLIDAVGIIASGSLRGAGDTRFPFLVSSSLAWLVRLPLVYLLAVVLHGGVAGAWLGELGFVSLLGTAWLLRFRAGAWRTVRI